MPPNRAVVNSEGLRKTDRTSHKLEEVLATKYYLIVNKTPMVIADDAVILSQTSL
jgi:hypothetical protein